MLPCGQRHLGAFEDCRLPRFLFELIDFIARVIVELWNEIVKHKFTEGQHRRTVCASAGRRRLRRPELEWNLGGCTRQRSHRATLLYCVILSAKVCKKGKVVTQASSLSIVAKLTLFH